MKKFFPIIILALLSGIFFSPMMLKGKMPIPSDTIVGLYHPFRDLFNKEYPNGIAYKNFLITDPIRQQIPWRHIALNSIRESKIPTWNPYSFAGYPLMGNFQSAVLYPFNILFYFFPFQHAWGFLVLLQPLLMSIFMYAYLRNLKINYLGCILGGIVFAYGGYSIAWLAWGTILHTGLWLPLVLLSIDKIFDYSIKLANSKIKSNLILEQLKNKNILTWSVILTLSLSSSILAGHLQTFFYLLIISISYILARWIQHGRLIIFLVLPIASYLLFLLLTIPQWLSTLQLIQNSARSIDQSWYAEGWFVPWQHLIQFIAPDFFGNPSTLNYWGVWNYGELIGYVGITPLLLAIFAIFFRKDKKTLYFGTLLFMSLFFSLPTLIAKIPFILDIPFISTAQPTRFLYVADFSLAALSAFGFDKLFKKYKSIHLMFSMLLVALPIALLWIFVFLGGESLGIGETDLMVARKNLILPTLLIATSLFLLFNWYLFNKSKYAYAILVFLISLTVFDLFRFGLKFTSFSDKDYFYPKTKTIEFLQKHNDSYRIMTLDDQIMPPNFNLMYEIQSIEGYDPLYVRRYGELISAIERDKPDIDPPFGFNRIIIPKNYNSRLIDLLNVKYILSFNEIESDKLKIVFTEGKTKIYENIEVFERAFLVENLLPVSSKKESINMMFDSRVNFKNNAIIEEWNKNKIKFTSGSAQIISYQDNKVMIETESDGEAFLIFMDTFYPTWKAKVCDSELERCNYIQIYRVNYNFRGVIVPAGRNKVIFNNHII